MAKYIKGNAVANATSYELFKKANGIYTSLKEASEINFEVSALGLASGDHILVVKAKADGYEDSEYSNEVTYTVSGGSSSGSTESGVNLFTEILDYSNGNDWYVMYSKTDQTAGTTPMRYGINTSNSQKAKNVVIEGLEAGATYSIYFKNNTGSGTSRCRMVTFAEAWDDIDWSALSTDVTTASVTTTNVIYYDMNNTTYEYETTFTNTLNHKTLVMTLGWASAAGGSVDLDVEVYKVS